MCSFPWRVGLWKQELACLHYPRTATGHLLVKKSSPTNELISRREDIFRRLINEISLSLPQKASKMEWIFAGCRSISDLKYRFHYNASTYQEVAMKSSLTLYVPCVMFTLVWETSKSRIARRVVVFIHRRRCMWYTKVGSHSNIESSKFVTDRVEILRRRRKQARGVLTKRRWLARPPGQ